MDAGEIRWLADSVEEPDAPLRLESVSLVEDLLHPSWTVPTAEEISAAAPVEADDWGRIVNTIGGTVPKTPWSDPAADPLKDIMDMVAYLQSEEYAEAVARQRQEWRVRLEMRLAELQDEAHLEETARGWEAMRWPSADELAAWLRACTAEELVRFCTRSLEDGQTALRCMTAMHDSFPQEVQALNDRILDLLTEVETYKRQEVELQEQVQEYRDTFARLARERDWWRDTAETRARLLDDARRPWWRKAWEWFWPPYDWRRS